MFYSKMFCYLKVVNVYYLLKVKKNHIEKLHYFQNDEKKLCNDDENSNE